MKKQWKHKNPVCKKCRLPLRKKGTFKIGEDRYFCPRCDKEEEDGE